MTDTAFALPDGSRLHEHKLVDGRPFGVDSETGKRGTYHGDDGGGRIIDRDGNTIREVARSAGRVAGGRPTSGPKSRPDRRRWVTLNTFVDRVARYLDSQEIAVWLVMFRWTQDDHAEIRLTDIASRVGKSTRAAKRAIDRLLEVGLLERLKRGTRQGGPSRYRLEPDPAVALPRLRATRPAPQQDTGVTLKVGPRHQKRDRSGAFTTGHGRHVERIHNMTSNGSTT